MIFLVAVVCIQVAAESIDEMSESLVDILVDRAITIRCLQDMSLDKTTIGKAQGHSSIPRAQISQPMPLSAPPFSSFPPLCAFFPYRKPPGLPPNLPPIVYSAAALPPFLPFIFDLFDNATKKLISPPCLPDWMDIHANMEKSAEKRHGQKLAACRNFEEFLQQPMPDRMATPIRPDEFFFLRDLFREPDSLWKTTITKPGVKIQRKFTKHSQSVLTRAFVDFHGIDPDVVLYNLIDIKARYAWDDMFTNLEYVDKKMHGNHVVYCQMPVPVVKNRDFVAYYRVKAEKHALERRKTMFPNAFMPTKGKGWSVILRSATHSKKPLRADQPCIRGELHLGGVTMYRADDSQITKVVYASMLDPCGAIPKWLVNLYATTKIYDSVEKLEGACKEVESKAKCDPILRARISQVTSEWKR